MCGVCQEVKSGSLQSSVFAAGFAGLAVGAKLSWQQLADRMKRRGDDPSELEPELAEPGARR